MPGTSEPKPGSLGYAYFLDRNNILKELNVLHRIGRDRCQVQDRTGAQIFDIDIEEIRTIHEMWDWCRAKAPDYLPAGMRTPITDKSVRQYWRPDKLPKFVLAKIWGRSESP